MEMEVRMIITVDITEGNAEFEVREPVTPGNPGSNRSTRESREEELQLQLQLVEAE